MEVRNSRQNLGFGMSQLMNLKVLAKDPKITEEAIETIRNFAKEEAPKDGKNIFLRMARPDNNDRYISAIISAKPTDILGKIKRWFAHDHVGAEYNPKNPVASFKLLIENAENKLKQIEKEKALKTAKLKIIQKKD